MWQLLEGVDARDKRNESNREELYENYDYKMILESNSVLAFRVGAKLYLSHNQVLQRGCWPTWIARRESREFNAVFFKSLRGM